MPDKKLEQDFKHLSATNDYLELAKQDAIALAESFKRERDQLREAAEKLAAALEFYANATASERIADGALAVKVLAEYRKQFPEKN